MTITAAELHAIRVELARQNLIDFCRLLAPPSFIWGAAQVAVCQFAQTTIETQGKGQVNLPPRSGKSQISSIYLPAWFLGRNPTKKVILLTGNLLLTSSFLEQLLTILQSDGFREVFPDLEILDASVNRINYRDRRHPRGERGRLVCMSVSRAAQGVGANLLLADDLISEQDAQSKIVKDKIWERWTSGLVTRLDPTWSAQLCIATRWSRDDPLGRMVAQDFEAESDQPWKVFKVPAIVSAEQAERINKVALADPVFKADLDDGRVQLLRGGGTCSPERMSLAFVEKQRASLTPGQFAALYQQEPAPEQGTIFLKSMFRPLDRAAMMEMRSHIAYSLMSVDLAFKGSEQSDYSAMLKIGVAPVRTTRLGQDYIQSTIVLESAFADRIQPSDLAKRVRQFYREWQVRQILLEDAASGTMVAQNLRRAGFPVVTFNPRKLPRGRNAKQERAALAAMLISSMPVYYDQNAAEVVAAIQNFLEFPKSDHDDLVDCLTQAVLFLRYRNEFDASFDTWSDEIELLREEFDPEDADEADERERAQRWIETPIERRPARSVYLMTPAERHRHAREQARKNRKAPVNPYTSTRIDLDD